MTEPASLSVLLAFVALLGALLGAWLGARLFAAKSDDSALLDQLKSLLANQDRSERTLREEAAHTRQEQAGLSATQRKELGERIQQFQQQFGAQLAEHQRQFSEDARAPEG